MDIKFQRKNILIWVSGVVVLAGAILGGAIGDRVLGYRLLDRWFPRKVAQTALPGETRRVLSEESVVIDVVDKASPSVVTVGIKRTQRATDLFGGSDPFSDFFGVPRMPSRGQDQKMEQDIGTGFIVSADGLIVTNKHVVSDTSSKYQVFLSGDKAFEVQKIYRDPANDLAIIKINAMGLKPVVLGDSSKLKVGQFVVAIGTALGEFRNTVTTGVISGLGRGITAGDPFGDAERLDNVIQTDAAINPGNSGGPLLNSSGEVIGVNAAVASQAQNVGFALPINLVRESIANFNNTGKFSRPFLGVKYRIVDRKTAILNEIPQGAFVQEVVSGSPADKAGIAEGDIIIKIDGTRVGDDESSLAKIISGHKVGDKINLEVWRDGIGKTVSALLEEAQ